MPSKTFFDHGYTVKLVVQHPNIPRDLRCQVQMDRILKSLGRYRDECNEGGKSGKGEIRIYSANAP